MDCEDCVVRSAVLWSGKPMDGVGKDRASSGIAGTDIFFSQNFAAQLTAGLCNRALHLSLANRAIDQEKSIARREACDGGSIFFGKCADQNKTFTELSPKSGFVTP
jgi:hypothetical protein